MEDKEYKKYEITFHIKEESHKEDVMKVLEDNKAFDINLEYLKRIELAYPIKKEKFAFMGYATFSIDPRNLKKLRDSLNLMDKVLRFMILKFEKENVKKEKRESNESQKEKKEEIKAAPKELYTNLPNMLTNESLEEKIKEILS
jgi:ribosomal protein S6